MVGFASGVPCNTATCPEVLRIKTSMRGSEGSAAASVIVVSFEKYELPTIQYAAALMSNINKLSHVTTPP